MQLSINTNAIFLSNNNLPYSLLATILREQTLVPNCPASALRRKTGLNFSVWKAERRYFFSQNSGSASAPSLNK